MMKFKKLFKKSKDENTDVNEVLTCHKNLIDQEIEKQQKIVKSLPTDEVFFEMLDNVKHQLNIPHRTSYQRKRGLVL